MPPVCPHAYLSHPQVRIDSAVPVPLWGLNDLGLARTEALARSGWAKRFARIVTSAETKAVETGAILAKAAGIPAFAVEAMHENDRSATGFLPPPEFEAVADAFFAHPEQSVRGWERAIDAQARILREVGAILDADDASTLFVGHGGVGTLLLCDLAGAPIARIRDQPAGGGNVFTFGWKPRALGTSWAALEACR